MRLRLAGILQQLGGMVVGRFTDYRPSNDWADMYPMIAGVLADLPFPVAFNAPIGHIDDNLPFIEGATVDLSVTPEGSKITEI